ncbi:hypothetical protein [Candidatus Entotheonella palauensis]|uniref:Uncharacterized protein n=1 Tax=Candidatus Entotheonella gemina TaxID=1429439 RepID=W4M4X6_9BACT|nr:hypothetical protein [Candidatus Entotheonella palauensis]ETX04986.1 MAG: hypothetical protein ETSY2_25695 [Candidatus Entotheonella gemina]
MTEASCEGLQAEDRSLIPRQAREDFRNLTLEDVTRQAEHLPWGTPQEVAERIIAAADRAGANMVQISLNRGAIPQEMFIEQIRRFAKEVLPALQAHEVRCVPATAAGAMMLEVFETAWQTLCAGREPSPASQAEMRSAVTLVTRMAFGDCHSSLSICRWGSGIWR